MCSASHQRCDLQKTKLAVSALQHDEKLRDATGKHKGADKPLIIVVTGLGSDKAAKVRGAQAQAHNATEEDFHYSRPMVASSDTIVGPSERSLAFWQRLATAEEFSKEIDAAYRKDDAKFKELYHYLEGLPEQMANAKTLWMQAVVRFGNLSANSAFHRVHCAATACANACTPSLHPLASTS